MGIIRRSHSSSSQSSTDSSSKLIWCNKKRDSFTTWETLDTDYKIQVDDNGNCSVLVPTPHSDEDFASATSLDVTASPALSSGSSSSWYGGVCSALNSTLYECKVAMSYLVPRLRFSMMCEAVLQLDGDSECFGVAVICHRTDSRTRGPEHHYRSKHTVVGGSIKPKMVRPGKLGISLLRN